MEHIKNSIKRHFNKQATLLNNINTALIIEEFNRIAPIILGAKVSQRMRPLYIKGNILTIVCLSPVVAQELNLNKNKIIAEINEKFGQGAITNIKFTL